MKFMSHREYRFFKSFLVGCLLAPALGLLVVAWHTDDRGQRIAFIVGALGLTIFFENRLNVLESDWRKYGDRKGPRND